MERRSDNRIGSRRAPGLVVVAFGLLAVVTGGSVVAHAAGLGGVTSARLTASTQATSTGAPTVVAWEDFTGTDGTNLNGTPTNGGTPIWTAIRGTWRIIGNQADASTGDVALVVDAGSPDRSVEATVRRGGTTFDIGVVANMNAAGTEFITVELTSAANGRLEMWRYNGGWTLLASVAGLYSGPATGWPASAVLRFESQPGGVMNVLLDGVPRLSHTLSAADQTVFKNTAHQRFGLYSYFDGVSRWDDFHVDA